MSRLSRCLFELNLSLLKEDTSSHMESRPNMFLPPKWEVVSRRRALKRERETNMFLGWNQPLDFYHSLRSNCTLKYPFVIFLASHNYYIAHTSILEAEHYPDPGIFIKSSYVPVKTFTLNFEYNRNLVDLVTLEQLEYKKRLLAIGGNIVRLMSCESNSRQGKKLRRALRKERWIFIKIHIHSKGVRYTSSLILERDGGWKSYYYDSRSDYTDTQTKLLMSYLEAALLLFDTGITMQYVTQYKALDPIHRTDSAWTDYFYLLSIVNPNLKGYDILHTLNQYGKFTLILIITIYYYQQWLEYPDVVEFGEAGEIRDTDLPRLNVREKCSLNRFSSM